MPSDSGLTEEQEDFIDYWSPQRVIDDCQAKRRLLAWVSNQRRSEDSTPTHPSQLSEILRGLVTGQLD